MKKLTIGILKHTKIGEAEKTMLRIIEEQGHHGIIINPLDIVYGRSSLPDAVIGRCELDSLEDVAFSAYFTYLEQCKNSISVINPQKFLLLGQDKYISHLAVDRYIKSKNLKYTINPETVLAFKIHDAYKLAQRMLDQWDSCVIKHPQSGRGVGVYLVKSELELDEVLKVHFQENTPIMIQKVINKEKSEFGGYKDIRLWVYRDHDTERSDVFDGYYRNSSSGRFLTNISQDGHASKLYHIDDELREYSKLVLDAVEGDVAGIDFAKDTDGNYWFLEVNIAFETSKLTLELLGDNIWRKTIELAISRTRSG